MTKVVYNSCYGGFGLSKQALDMYEDITGNRPHYWEIPRHDKALVQVVERLGSGLASGFCADLQIETIKGNQYRIDEYDGNETVEIPEDIEWIEY